MKFASITSHLRQMRAAYWVLIITLIPAWVTFVRVRSNIKTREMARFERMVSENQIALERRVVRCMDQLYNVRALFAASESVELDEWKAYLSSMTARHTELGIRSLGYIEQVTAATRAEFLKRRRADTKINFDITPAGERPVYYPAVYVTHFDSTAEAVYGLDHSVRPERLEVIRKAIDVNRPLATAKVNFMASDGLHTNSGVFVYLPIYKNNSSIGDPVQRRSAIQGLAYMTIVPEAMLSVLFDTQENGKTEVDIEVFEGESADPAKLLYDGDRVLRANNRRLQPELTRQVTVPFLNRQWTIFFSTTSEFERESPRYLQWLTLGGGLLVSFFLFAITSVQIKARARAEEDAAKLQRSEGALAAEKERLSVTLNSIAEGVITCDAAGNVVAINRAAERMTGVPQTEAAGKSLGEVFDSLLEENREPRVSPAKKVIETGLGVSAERYAILLARDGTERIITDSAAPLFGKTGELIGAVLVFRDMTESRKSEVEMLKESKLESVGLLAGGIAHDFNNILTGIIGNISLARMSVHSTDKVMERLAGVERSAQRARDLTHQLLTFAKGGAPIRRWAQLPELVKDVCQYAIIGSNVQAEYSLPLETWPVELDEGQFRQALNHLVINAMQSMPDGGQMEVRLENVELTAGFLPPLAAGKYVKLSIRDHGSGIPLENLPRIFEPYFTTKKNGSGLGLATAYSVVRKHDGQIRVESTDGKGTTFQIYLPASLRPPTPKISETAQKEFFGHGKILVMDDEPDVLEIAREMLKLCGYEVHTARDGAEAIEMYVTAKSSGHPFDALVMDLTVPNGMGGRDAIRRLKEIAPEVKAIVSSGYSFDPVMANYKQYGFVGIIPKPYQFEELARVLREVLVQSSPDKKSAEANTDQK